MWKRSVWVGCIALAVVAATPASAATQLRFDELESGAVLNSQYGVEGVVFGPDPERWAVFRPASRSYPPPSVPNVAWVPEGAAGEVLFQKSAAGVSARFLTGASTVTVTALDADGNVLGQQSLTSGYGKSVPYSFAPANGRVVKLVIEGQAGLWALDDLVVDTGVPPVTAARVDGTAGRDGWFRSEVTVHLGAGDPDGDAVAAIRYSVDGGPVVETPGPEVSFPISTEGKHVVSYSSVDATGKQEAWTPREVNLDWTGPVLQILSPSAPSFALGAPVTVTASTEDATSRMAESSLTLDGATPLTSGQTLSDLPAGAHWIALEGRDVAGNSASARVEFSVLAPATTLTVHGAGSARLGSRKVALHVWGRAVPGRDPSGHLLLVDPTARLHVRCERILSLRRTAAGVTLTAEGTAQPLRGPAKRCTVTLELLGAGHFTLQFDSTATVAGQLLGGRFSVR